VGLLPISLKFMLIRRDVIKKIIFMIVIGFALVLSIKQALQQINKVLHFAN
jgi:multisubunit Na+/H+ antiporter MnhC subunit